LAPIYKKDRDVTGIIPIIFEIHEPGMGRRWYFDLRIMN